MNKATSGQKEYQVDSLTWIGAHMSDGRPGLMVAVKEKEGWVVARHGSILIYVAIRLVLVGTI
jgi:hypothetical protein